MLDAVIIKATPGGFEVPIPEDFNNILDRYLAGISTNLVTP